MSIPPPLNDHLKQAFAALLQSSVLHEISRSKNGPPSLALLSGSLQDGTPIGIISIMDPQPDRSMIFRPLAIIPSTPEFFDTVHGPDGTNPTIQLDAPPETPADIARRAGLIVPPSHPGP